MNGDESPTGREADASPSAREPGTSLQTAKRAPLRRLARRALVLLPLVALALAFEVIRDELRVHHVSEIVAGLRATPAAAILIALALTGVAYLVLSGHDFLALRYVGSSLPYRRSAPVSMLAYGVANAVGFPLFTSTPIRFRFYTAAGIEALDVVRIVSFTTVSFWLGLAGLAGPVLLVAPASLAASQVPLALARTVGLVLTALAPLYLVLAALRRRPLRLGSWRFSLPSWRLAVGQIAIAVSDWMLTALVLWSLLRDREAVGLPAFLTAFLASHFLALVSHVPGGLGVFEASMITLLTPALSVPELVGAMVVYRAVYYLLPLVLATSGLVFAGRRTIARLTREVEEGAAPVLGVVVPRVLAVATFAAGAVLIVSGALPEIPARLTAVLRFLPHALLEISHLLSAVVGALLLVLANSLRRRLDAAWHVVVWLLLLGIVFALGRGLDIEEASVLGAVLVLLLFSKRHFYRRATLLGRPWTPRWFLGVGLVVVCSLWLGWINHRGADLTAESFLEFSRNAALPRFLRAQVAVLASLLVLATLRLLEGAKPTSGFLSPKDEVAVEEIAGSSRDSTAWLALLGDKRFVFDDAKRGFVMYGVVGSRWIAMGDPIGPPEVVDELIWRFREEADLWDESPVFYEARPTYLGAYLEAGLSALKLGENARTPLADFSLEGSKRKELRHCVRRGDREGLEYEVVAREDVPPLLPDLRAISDDWLARKSSSEKAFSLGRFDERYLRHFPVALVRRGDRILAFANLFLGGGKTEVSVDLMRYRDSAPPGTMDYLLVQTMLWGRDHGYRWFNLGMTPLAGLESHPLAPLWYQVGAWLFHHGEHFYNFRGLRDYKEKFAPEWEPRYLIAPHGLAASRALVDVSFLVAGGVRGLVSR